LDRFVGITQRALITAWKRSKLIAQPKALH